MNKITSVQQKGLQTKGKFLVVLIPMLIISMSVMAVLNIYYVKKSTSTALEESLKETVKIASSRVTDRAKADVSLASSIASRVGIMYADKITSEYDKKTATAFEKQMAALGENYGFMHMYIIDANGFACTSKHSDVKKANLEYYEPIVNGAESYTTDPILDTAKFAGQYKLNVVVPVKDIDGKYIGMLVCMVNANDLCELVTGIGVGEGGSTFIMDDNGRCIAHKDSQMLYDGEKYLKMRNKEGYASLNALWDTMTKNKSGYATYEYEGSRLAAYTGIDKTNNWSIAVTVSEDEFMEQSEKAILTAVIVAFVLILLCGGIIIRFLNHISKRIGDVTERIEAVAQGDFGKDFVDVQTTDEIGRLEAASNKLNEDIHLVINRIDTNLSEISDGMLSVIKREPLTGDYSAIDDAFTKNRIKLGEMILDISRTAEQVSCGSEQMANGASNLAQGAAEQASSVEELFTGVTELSKRAQAVGGNYSGRYDFDNADIDDISENSGNTENSENTENSKSTENNSENSEAHSPYKESLTGRLVSSMSRIEKACDSIRKLATDIDSLASETGMLALNASVEATHAGEFGKGFAVIASEIRSLAEKSREAAKTAEKMTDDILKSISRGNKTVEYTVESVDEIAAAVAQFKNTLEQISNVIESTAATAEETAAGSEELSTQANMLKEMISGFTYKSEETTENDEWEQNNG